MNTQLREAMLEAALDVAMAADCEEQFRGGVGGEQFTEALAAYRAAHLAYIDEPVTVELHRPAGVTERFEAQADGFSSPAGIASFIGGDL